MELSAVTQTTISRPFSTPDASGPKHLTVTRMRSTFEQITAAHRAHVRRSAGLSDAKLTRDDIDEVILVGGSNADRPCRWCAC